MYKYSPRLGSIKKGYRIASCQVLLPNELHQTEEKHFQFSQCLRLLYLWLRDCDSKYHRSSFSEHFRSPYCGLGPCRGVPHRKPFEPLPQNWVLERWGILPKSHNPKDQAGDRNPPKCVPFHPLGGLQDQSALDFPLVSSKMRNVDFFSR